MPPDALTLLEDDHRRLARTFERFQAARTLWEEEELAFDIIAAMRTHLDIDRNVFYPALSGTADEYQVRKSLADHDQIDLLLTEIEDAGPTEDAFFAKIHLLCELFSQHVRDEERPRGVFDEARQSSVDLRALGMELERRKAQLSVPLAPA